jgi:predicted kinase
LRDDGPVLFDCIEFNDVLSDLDVQYDLAFLLMDLDFRGRRDAAVRALSAYLDEAGRSFPPDLWAGVALLPLMLSVRAGVRAHVTAHSDDPDTARAYVEAAIAHLAPQAPTLVAVGGLSGAGKSTFSRTAAPLLGASPGAVILRTDEVRKRLLKQTATMPAGSESYAPDAYARTYDEMFVNARALLAAGRSVVLDASFMEPAQRARAEALARDAGVPFRAAWLQAPSEVLEARIASRTGDASDATIAVLREQLRRDLGPLSWPSIDVSGSTEEAARAWSRAEP